MAGFAVTTEANMAASGPKSHYVPCPFPLDGTLCLERPGQGRARLLGAAKPTPEVEDRSEGDRARGKEWRKVAPAIIARPDTALDIRDSDSGSTRI